MSTFNRCHGIEERTVIDLFAFCSSDFYIFLIQSKYLELQVDHRSCSRLDDPVGVRSDLSTPTGLSCIGSYGENCKSDNTSKYRALLVGFQLL